MNPKSDEGKTYEDRLCRKRNRQRTPQNNHAERDGQRAQREPHLVAQCELRGRGKSLFSHRLHFAPTRFDSQFLIAINQRILVFFD